MRRLGPSLLSPVCAVGLVVACGSSPESFVAQSTTAEDGSPWAYVRVPVTDVTPQFIQETGWERDHKRDDIYAFGYLKTDSLDELPTRVRQNIRVLDAKTLAHYAFDAKTLELSDWPLPQNKTGFAAYHDYTALTQALQDIADRYPAITRLSSLGKSEDSRDIWTIELTGKNQDDPGLPEILYVANMHGDEVVGRELMIYLVTHLTESYGRDPRITRLLDFARILIVPSLNPDGFERKARHNRRNVDLNRNFPDFTTDQRDQPSGRAAETKAIMALHDKHFFILSANFHGGEVCFNMPWDTQPNNKPAERFGDDLLMGRLGRTYADLNPTMRENSGGSFDRGVTYGYEWYEVNGGLQDWSIFYRSSTHATLELSYAKWPPANQLPRYWEENKEALLGYLESALYGVHLRVVSPEGTLIPQVTVRVSTLPRDLTYPTGYIHRLALPGSQWIRISAPGYGSIEKAVEPMLFDGSYQTVVLPQSPQ